MNNNKLKKAILGLAIADAVGVPAEFKSRKELMNNPIKDMIGFGTHDQPEGTWSDDTSLTLCLLESLSKGLDYNDIFTNFQKWKLKAQFTAHDEVFDIGIATSQALNNYVLGVNPLECGGNDEFSNGNGSLMRILPLIFYIREEYGRELHEKYLVFDFIHNVSRLTHGHIRSQIACGIYLMIANELIEGNSIESSISKGSKIAKEYYSKFDNYKKELKFYDRILENNIKLLHEDLILSSGYVVHTLEAALWCLATTTTYKECVLKAVNLGEDTDTVAAVAGGLAGLVYGIEGIPIEWLDKLVRKEVIESICDDFYKPWNET